MRRGEVAGLTPDLAFVTDAASLGLAALAGQFRAGRVGRLQVHSWPSSSRDAVMGRREQRLSV